MQELFGDRRPPRAVFEPERFLHTHPGDAAGARAVTAATPTSPIAIVRRRRTWSVAAALVAVLAGGAYLLGSRMRSPRDARLEAARDTALTAAAPAAATVTQADTSVVPATEVTAAADAAALIAAQHRPQLHSPPAVTAPRKRRTPPKRTASTRTSVRERDLDAPFPR
jgi:hypothetical protein